MRSVSGSSRIQILRWSQSNAIQGLRSGNAGNSRWPKRRASSSPVALDHLNTHGPASFYEAFAPGAALKRAMRVSLHAEARPLAHNMAEIELRVLSRQGLARRLGDAETLRNETRAWQQQRNVASKTIDGQFTTADARIKLKRLYPAIKI